MCKYHGHYKYGKKKILNMMINYVRFMSSILFLYKIGPKMGLRPTWNRLEWMIISRYILFSLMQTIKLFIHSTLQLMYLINLLMGSQYFLVNSGIVIILAVIISASINYSSHRMCCDLIWKLQIAIAKKLFFSYI